DPGSRELAPLLLGLRQGLLARLLAIRINIDANHILGHAKRDVGRRVRHLANVDRLAFQPLTQLKLVHVPAERAGELVWNWGLLASRQRYRGPSHIAIDLCCAHKRRIQIAALSHWCTLLYASLPGDAKEGKSYALYRTSDGNTSLHKARFILTLLQNVKLWRVASRACGFPRVCSRYPISSSRASVMV